MSIWTYRKAVLESDLSATTKLVLLVLDNHVNDMGDPCFPAYSRVANLASLSRRSVISQVSAAEKFGWIRIERRPQKKRRHKTNYFFLTIPNTAFTSNAGQMNGEPNSPMKQIHPQGELDSPANGELGSPKRTTTKRANNQPQQPADDLIFPDIPIAEKNAIIQLLSCAHSLGEVTKQKIIDELAGAIQKNSIKRGHVPFVGALIRAATLGKFEISLGIAIQSNRQLSKQRLVEQVAATARENASLDPRYMDKGIQFINNIRRHTGKQTKNQTTGCCKD